MKAWQALVTGISHPKHSKGFIEILSPWDFLGKNTGVGSHSLLQGVFPTLGLNQGLPHCRRFFTIWATREALKDISAFNSQFLYKVGTVLTPISQMEKLRFLHGMQLAHGPRAGRWYWQIMNFPTEHSEVVLCKGDWFLDLFQKEQLTAWWRKEWLSSRGESGGWRAAQWSPIPWDWQLIIVTAKPCQEPPPWGLPWSHGAGFNLGEPPGFRGVWESLCRSHVALNPLMYLSEH